MNKWVSKIRSGWNSFSSKCRDIAESIQGKASDKIDTELGIYIHKNIGTLFFFDEQVKEYEGNIKEYARNGEKEKALAESQKMKSYIMYNLKHNRKYQSKAKDIGQKIGEKKDQLIQKIKSVKDSRLLSWLKSQNQKTPDQLEQKEQNEEN